MPWPNIWPFARRSDKDEQSVSAKVTDTVDNILHQAKELKPPTAGAFSQLETWLAAGGMTVIALVGFRFYRSYLRRIPQATDIRPGFLRKRSILGRVTSVGDGDNFRMYHTPGGRLTGWGWLPWRRVPTEKKALKNQTIHVRLAGVDAPEMPHFGRPEQPYAKEAYQWLTDYLGTRRVRAYVYKQDQYSRVVATVHIWKGILRRDVGLQMLRAGMATVYEANTGAEFGNFEDKYRKAERWAKTKRKGLWAGKNKSGFETPGEYKKRHGSGTPIDEIRVSPAASVEHHHNKRDSSEDPTATASVTQVIPPHTEVEEQPEGQEQGQEEPDSSGGDLTPSRPPDTPIASSPSPVPESGTILEGQSAEAVQECRPWAQIASRAVSPARVFARPEGGICVNVGDVTFLHVDGHRETASGPEYLFMGKMWLGADAGVPFDLLRAYRREITQGDRLATLRILKRTIEEADVVKATGRSTRKQVKRT